MKKGVITNTVCIITAIVCIALTFWGNLKNDGVLSTDAYMGVIATLIGICAAIVVGFQIVSFIELQNFRKQVNEMEALRKQMEQDNIRLQKQTHTLQTGLSNAFMLILDYNQAQNKDIYQALSYCTSIICASWDNPSNAKAMLIKYNNLHAIICKINTTDKSFLSKIKKFLIKLNDIEIPKNWPKYHEIMKIHCEILSILAQVDDEPTAETEQK